MKIKVCGMRDRENIQSLLALKPDFIGFIFYKKSKRFVADIPKINFPKEIKKVGVFVNEPIDEIFKILEKHQLDCVQLHGEETPEYCKEMKTKNIEILKAFSINEDFDFSKTASYQKVCDYFLFDTKGKEYGGNGVKFNWEILKEYKGKTPFLLSGGISKTDAIEINKIKIKSFVGVDINSGFELKPALKNIEDIKEFKQNLV
jgi:phosphoribosylanthranilate isomerase